MAGLSELSGAKPHPETDLPEDADGWKAALAEPQRSQKLGSVNLAVQAPSMPIEMLSIEQLADSEGETLRANIREFPLCFAFANNALSLMSTGIVGYVASRKAFGAYLSQVNVNLCLGLMSALRQHKVQAYSNLRHALEHFALAAYALHHTDDATYFDTDPEHPVDHRKLMKNIVYPWLKKAYPRQSEEVEKLKGYINRDHAHASILHAYRTLEGIEGEANTVKTNYIDMTDPKSVAADLIHVGHVAFTGFELIVEANRPVSVIVGKDGIEDEANRVRQYGRAALKEMREIEAKLDNGDCGNKA